MKISSLVQVSSALCKGQGDIFSMLRRKHGRYSGTVEIIYDQK